VNRPTVSDKVVRHSLAYLSVKKWFTENVPFYVKIWPKLANPLQKRQFPINIRSAFAVTSIEKSSINTNRKYTTSFPMSVR